MAIPNKRIVHTKMWEDPKFTLLKPTERLLYIGMINFGDDEGRLRGDGAFLKKYFFYSDRIGANKLEMMRDHIAKIGLILVYKNQNETFIQHPEWHKLQTLRKDRLRKSDYPPPSPDIWQPPDNHTSTEDNLRQDNKTQDKDKENITEEKPTPRQLMQQGIKNAFDSSF